MTSLDARALTSDPEGMSFLGAVLGPSAERPCLETRFGVSPSVAYGAGRRRDPTAPPARPRRRSRGVRQAC